jgi:large subunit ribosomal protein L9
MSDDGKLFGSVGMRDIIEALNAAGVEVEKSEIHLHQGPIKDVGDYEISVSVHPEVQTKITVSVIGEKSEK